MLPKISLRPLVTDLNCQSYRGRKAILHILMGERGIFPLDIEMMFKWQSIKELIHRPANKELQWKLQEN